MAYTEPSLQYLNGGTEKDYENSRGRRSASEGFNLIAHEHETVLIDHSMSVGLYEFSLLWRVSATQCPIKQNYLTIIHHNTGYLTSYRTDCKMVIYFELSRPV